MTRDFLQIQDVSAAGRVKKYALPVTFQFVEIVLYGIIIATDVTPALFIAQQKRFSLKRRRLIKSLAQ